METRLPYCDFLPFGVSSPGGLEPIFEFGDHWTCDYVELSRKLTGDEIWMIRVKNDPLIADGVIYMYLLLKGTEDI
jgi:hypothetical protein